MERGSELKDHQEDKVDRSATTKLASPLVSPSKVKVMPCLEIGGGGSKSTEQLLLMQCFFDGCCCCCSKVGLQL